jgi:hypothetical protein
MGVFLNRYLQKVNNNVNKKYDTINLEIMLKTIDNLLPKVSTYIEDKTLYGEKMTDTIDLTTNTVIIATYDIDNPPAYIPPVTTIRDKDFTKKYTDDVGNVKQMMNVEFLLNTLEEWCKYLLLYINNKSIDVTKLASTLNFQNHIVYVATPPL